MKRIWWVVAAAWAALGIGAPVGMGQSTFGGAATAGGAIVMGAARGPGENAMGASFFGMHVNSLNNGYPPAGWFGGNRLWDSGTNWFQIEAVAGSYNFGSATTGFDARLVKAKSQGMDVLYTFGHTPQFYVEASHQSDSCNGASSAGWCWPPADVDAAANSGLGDGSNAHWRNFVYEWAWHVKNLGISCPTCVAPVAVEVWNEANIGGMWKGSNRQLVRLQDDLHCVLHGEGTIHGLDKSCAEDAANFPATHGGSGIGLLPGMLLVSASPSSSAALPWWESYYAEAGATESADAIAVHAYGYTAQAMTVTGFTRSGDGKSVTASVSALPATFQTNLFLFIYGATPESFNGGPFVVTDIKKTGSPQTVTYQQMGTAGETGTAGYALNSVDEAAAGTANFMATLSAADQAKPLWITEGSWGGTGGTTDPDTRMGSVVRWYANQWSAGAKRAFWYGWDFLNDSGVLWNSGQSAGAKSCASDATIPPCLAGTNLGDNNGYGWLTGVGQAYRTFENLALGTVMTRTCGPVERSSVHRCEFRRSDGATMLAVWDSAQDKWALPASGCTATEFGCATFASYAYDPKYVAWYDWNGTRTGLSGGTLPVGTKPVYLVDGAW